MSTNAIRLCLQRLKAPSAHAWRRGWVVQSLRSGVSEASVRASAGWATGAMVARYTNALSGELAVEEFQNLDELSDGKRKCRNFTHHLHTRKQLATIVTIGLNCDPSLKIIDFVGGLYTNCVLVYQCNS